MVSSLAPLLLVYLHHNEKSKKKHKSEGAYCDLSLPEGSDVFDLNELKVLSWLNPPNTPMRPTVS